MGKKKSSPPAAPVVSAPQKDKAGKRRSRQARAGLEISPARCKRIIAMGWKGGKISTEASVIMAAFLQYLAGALLSSADLWADGEHINAGHLSKALDSMPWIRGSGVVRGNVVGAARSE